MLLKEPVTLWLLSPTEGQAREKHEPHNHYTPQHTVCQCTRAEHAVRKTNAAFSSLTKCNLDPYPPNFLSGTACGRAAESNTSAALLGLGFPACFPTHSRNVINNTCILRIWRMHTRTYMHMQTCMQYDKDVHTHIQTILAVLSIVKNYCT